MNGFEELRVDGPKLRVPRQRSGLSRQGGGNDLFGVVKRRGQKAPGATGRVGPDELPWRNVRSGHSLIDIGHIASNLNGHITEGGVAGLMRQRELMADRSRAPTEPGPWARTVESNDTRGSHNRCDQRPKFMPLVGHGLT